MRNFRDLQVWNKAHVFTLRLHKVTQNFPREEAYGLTRQIRRASCSIPSNIAEGSGRRGDVEFARFLDIALGSAYEVNYQLLLSKDLGYITEEDYNDLFQGVTEVEKMLIGFIHKIRPISRKPAKGV
jgi:four helix bundle protein